MSVLRIKAEFFKALGHPCRLNILEKLQKGEQCVCHLTEKNMTQANLSQHLKILKDSGLVRSRKKGLYNYYSIRNSETADLLQLGNRIIKEYIDDLSEGLEENS